MNILARLQLAKEPRVDSVSAPGLSYYIAISSSTSGKESNLFPAYKHKSLPPCPILDFNGTWGPTTWVLQECQVEREPGQVVKKIPLCGAMQRKLDRAQSVVPDNLRAHPLSLLISIKVL